MHSWTKVAAVVVLWAFSIASGCVREPKDLSESIPSGNVLVSEKYGFKLSVPGTVEIEKEEMDASAAWKFFYTGYETAPVMELKATLGGFAVPPDWRKTGTRPVSTGTASVYKTPEGETKTVFSKEATFILTGANRSFDSIFRTISFDLSVPEEAEED